MAPSRQSQVPPYAKDEKVLCFHGDLMYEAKIIEVSVKPGQKPDDAQYRIHYKGWKASWDDWVSQDRIRKFTEDNKQLASQLQLQARMRAQGSKGGKKGVKANGSEMSSARGSEERAAGSSSFGGRGPRRGRDYELENVSLYISFAFELACIVTYRIPRSLNLGCLRLTTGPYFGSTLPIGSPAAFSSTSTLDITILNYSILDCFRW